MEPPIAPQRRPPQGERGFTWAPAIYYRAAPDSAWEEQLFSAGNGCPVSIIRRAGRDRVVAIARE